MFLTFNKIKNILANGPENLENVIRKSLTNSTILELSEDQTKVRRKGSAPVKSQEEIDECTIYIEQIPINSTHESLMKIFSRFGKVNYVSLPRYKNRVLKQFGFIEFDDADSIAKAISCFRKVDGVLQYTSLKAENLLSIVTHEKEAPEVEDKSAVPESDEPPTKKARIEVAEAAEVEVEKSKVPVEEKEENKVEEDPASAKETEMEADDAAEDSEQKPEEAKVEGESPKKKKRRKHKKKTGQKAKFFDERVMAIKIMRKKEWKKMRNAYLNLERQKAKEIKKILRDSYNKRNNIKIQENQKFSPANTASPRINFYGSPNDREEHPVEATYEANSDVNATGLMFVPGVIVNVKFREPCLDLKELKKEFKQYSYVNYVDILEGGAQCYVRVDAPTSAQELLSQYSSCEYETEVLKDESEKEYWKKIFEKRDAKKNKEAPKKEQPAVKRRRGREKLIEKINKAAHHIRFEDSEDVVE